jgi:hypothetical protein
MLFLIIISQNIKIQDLELSDSTEFPALIEQTHESELQVCHSHKHDYTVNQTIRNHSLNNIALIFWLLLQL